MKTNGWLNIVPGVASFSGIAYAPVAARPPLACSIGVAVCLNASPDAFAALLDRATVSVGSGGGEVFRAPLADLPCFGDPLALPESFECEPRAWFRVQLGGGDWAGEPTRLRPLCFDADGDIALALPLAWDAGGAPG